MVNLHKDIKELINEFRIGLGHLLNTKLYGLYIYNSVAMGKFEPKYSDIDFMVIINSSLTDNELNEIIKMHKKIGVKYEYGSKLEGMYMKYEDIGKLNKDMNPYSYTHDSKFYKEGYYDINYVTWWSLKEYDMAIKSPSIKSNLEHIKWDSVLNTMEYNLNHYWTDKLQDTKKFEEDMWVEFGIVTLSRIIYTLEKGRIISKSDACKYILKDYIKYHDIVNEALAIRDLKPRSIISDISLRRDKTTEFITDMINYGNRLLEVASNNNDKCKRTRK